MLPAITNHMKNYTKILLFTILCFYYSNAQTSNKATKSVKAEKVTEQTKVNLSEGEAYKLLYENVKEFLEVKSSLIGELIKKILTTLRKTLKKN